MLRDKALGTGGAIFGYDDVLDLLRPGARGEEVIGGAAAHHRHDLVARRDRPDGHIDQWGDAHSAADQEQVPGIAGQFHGVPKGTIHAHSVAPRALREPRRASADDVEEHRKAIAIDAVEAERAREVRVHPLGAAVDHHELAGTGSGRERRRVEPEDARPFVGGFVREHGRGLDVHPATYSASVATS